MCIKSLVSMVPLCVATSFGRGKDYDITARVFCRRNQAFGKKMGTLSNLHIYYKGILQTQSSIWDENGHASNLHTTRLFCRLYPAFGTKMGTISNLLQKRREINNYNIKTF